MPDLNTRQQKYFRTLEAKLDAYYVASLTNQPVEELNADLKGFLEAGMILNVTSKDVLDAIIQSRYRVVSEQLKAAGGKDVPDQG